MTERTGICSICGGAAEPAYTCMFCGATCCIHCFVPELKLCRNCAKRARK